MKKVLITGANGFIGSFLVEEALKRNYEVYAGIRKECDTQYLIDNRISFFELEYNNTESLKKTFGKAPQFDLIIHNAGLTKADKKSDYFTVNFEYTKNIIDALIEQKKVPGKFVYMSSLAAYGPADHLLNQEVRQSDIPNPITSYGKSKLESEKYISGLSNFPFLIIRPTAVYGPREKDLYTFFKMINRNLEPYIGKKDQDFTFIYIKDLIKAVFLAAETNEVNKSYFVSDGNVYPRNTLGQIIKNHLNKKTIPVTVPLGLVRMAAYITETTNYLTGKTSIFNLEKVNELGSVNWKCDTETLSRETGFYPDYNLDSGIAETVAWYKKEKWL